VPPEAVLRAQVEADRASAPTDSFVWNGTGDPVTYVKLQDNPNFYLEKISQHFGLDYDPRVAKRQGWIYRDNDEEYQEYPGGDDFLNQSPAPDIYSFDSPHWERINFAISGAAEISGYRDYMHPFTGGHYKLAINHPDPTIGVRESRKIKYFYGVQELQNIIEEDLITGISGYNVSPVGDIQNSSYGPYMLQCRATGFNPSNGIFISYISDPHNMSGSIRTFPGSDTPSLPLPRTDILRFHKTGSGFYEISCRSKTLTPNIIYDVEAKFNAYDISAGRYLGENESYRTLLSNSGIFDEDLHSNGLGKIYEERQIRTNQDIIEELVGLTLEGMYLDIEYITDQPINPEDPQKIFHITGAREFYTTTRLAASTTTTLKQSTFYNEISVVGDEYSEEDYFWCGAPTGYVHPRLIDITSFSISGCNDFSGLITPNYLSQKTDKDLGVIRILDCPNFKDLFLEESSSAMSIIEITGTQMDTQNYFHPLANATGTKFYEYPVSVYPEQPKFFLSGLVPEDTYHQMLPFPKSLHIVKPPHLLSDYPSDIILDQPYHNPCAVIPGPIQSSSIGHIDVRNNHLNQTGIYAWVISALETKVISGTFRCEGQKPRRGPQAPVFDGLREDPYLAHHKTIYGENLDAPNVPEVLINDVNNFCMSGMQQLIDAGWIITYDNSYGPQTAAKQI
jgi:hypothetical protein